MYMLFTEIYYFLKRTKRIHLLTSILRFSNATVATILVKQLPPKLSRNILVIIELR